MPRLGLHSPYQRTLATPLEVKPGALPGEALTLHLDALLNRALLKSKANERLRLGILKQSVLDRLWRFMKYPDFPPTNNAAERSLRTVVMARKV